MADLNDVDQAPAERALPTPFADTPYSAEGFGAGVGSAIQQGGNVVAGIAREAKEKADTSAVIGAIGMAKKSLNDIILDPQAGYIATRGDDAIKNRDKYLSKFDDAVGGVESALVNDDQRRAFRQHANNIREEATRHAYSHESAQIEDVSKAAFSGAADQTIRTIQASIGSPDDLGNQLADLRQIATAEGQRRFGNDPAAVQSIVAPVMQKGAIDAMEAATSSGNPALAKSTFEKVAPFLLNHERHYAALVTAIDQKQQINSQASATIAGAVTPVIVPGGAQVPRLDATKLSSAVLTLPDGPLRDDVTKAIEQRQIALDKIWDQTKAQQVAAAQTAGTNAATGAFSMDRVPPPLKVWLQQNAPDKLIALRALDARAQKLDSGEDKRISAGNYNNLAAETLDPTLRKQKFAQMTPEQFQSYLRDEYRFPGGFTLADERRALQQFKGIKLAATKLEEPIPSAVTEILKVAVPNDPNAAKKYVGPLHDSLQQFVTDYETQHKGVAPSSAEVREYGMKQMARGSVTAVGSLPGFFDFNSVRRVDFQNKPEFSGKQFNPKEGGSAELPRAVNVREKKSGRVKSLDGATAQRVLQSGDFEVVP